MGSKSRRKRSDEDIYSLDFIEELVEDDEISMAENGFMQGYMEGD